MDFVYIKQENMFVWPCRWSVLLSALLMWLPGNHGMITSKETCAGQQLSLTCTKGWLIHIIYETYSFSASPCTTTVDPGNVICTKAEFLAPLSVGHCNGKGSCAFTVPTNTTISSCNKTASALSVHYKCISEASVFSICSDVTFQQTQQLYLATPDFPSNILGQQKNCSCSLIGENINGTVLQQTRVPGSSVIMILSTNRGTQHINGLNILNTIVFTNLTKINLFLENKRQEQVYKIWLGFKGKGMSLKCQYERPEPETSPAGVSVNPTMSLVTNETQGYAVTSLAVVSVNPTMSLVTNETQGDPVTSLAVVSVNPTMSVVTNETQVDPKTSPAGVKPTRSLVTNETQVDPKTSPAGVKSTRSLVTNETQVDPKTSPAGVKSTRSLVTNETQVDPKTSPAWVKPTRSLVINETQGDILLSTVQSKVNQTISFVENVSVTPTRTFKSQSNIINCSETKNNKNIKCNSDNVAVGVSSSLIGVPSSWDWTRELDTTVPTGVHLISTQTESSIQEMTSTEEKSKLPTKSLIFTKLVTPMQTVNILFTDTRHIQSSMGNIIGTSVTENSEMSSETASGTENSGTLTENSGISTGTENLETSSVTENLRTPTVTDQKLGTNTPTIGMPSSVISNTNQSNLEFSPKTADQDVTLLVIVGCLAFVLMVAIVIFTVIVWRRANANQYAQEETHIYDAYHHDNGSAGPDPLGHNHSYYASANESILT